MSVAAGRLDGMLIPDDDTCYRAVQSRDPRFDGWFFTAVRTTGIYCRPSCPAITPQRRNVTFHPSAAAAQRAGYRACKRCRPDASPGSPEWNVRGDLAGRALRLIGDGVIDREGVPGLASRLGYSERQVHRTLMAEVGAGPLALARAQRAQTARVLLETTELPVTDVAFAAGFASVRQFNDTVRDGVRGDARARCGPGRRRGAAAEPGVVTLRLPYREPMSVSAVLDFLGAHAVPGLETYADGVFTRVVDAPRRAGAGRAAAGDGAVRVPRAAARHARSRHRGRPGAAAARSRRRPGGRRRRAGADPHLAPLVAQAPGHCARPAHVDGFETAIRTIVGQQISLSGARTVLGRIVAEHGRPAFEGEPWRLFPTADTLAAVDPATLPMPRARGRSVHALSTAFAAGGLALDPGADRDGDPRRAAGAARHRPVDGRLPAHARRGASRRPARPRISWCAAPPPISASTCTAAARTGRPGAPTPRTTSGPTCTPTLWSVTP